MKAKITFDDKTITVTNQDGSTTLGVRAIAILPHQLSLTLDSEANAKIFSGLAKLYSRLAGTDANVALVPTVQLSGNSVQLAGPKENNNVESLLNFLQCAEFFTVAEINQIIANPQVGQLITGKTPSFTSFASTCAEEARQGSSGESTPENDLPGGKY